MLKFFTYLSKMFLTTWLMTVFGFLVLIGLLDSLANGGDIMSGDGGFSNTFRYMMLRAPVIFDRIFVFTIVVAILLTFVKLIRQHELVALLGFGISVPKQIMLLTPAVLAAGFTSITFIDYAIAPAVRSLQAWGIGEYKVKNITPNNPLWLEDNRRIIRAEKRINYEELGNLEIYQRSETGQVEDVLWAEKAVYKAPNWELVGVQSLPIKGAEGDPRMPLRSAAPEIWETAQTPMTIARLAAEPRDLSLSEMRQFKKPGNSGSKPRFAYSFWHAHRMTRPVAAWILLLCAVPMMQRTGRQDTGDKALIIGISMGFIFLIIDGAMATFATSGGIGVTSAIAGPLIVFTLLGSYLCLKAESL